MMDPLSISLAVITVATALKDIIETAKAIQDSFSKPLRNYRNARKLADEVLDTLCGIEEIYQGHETIFNKTKFATKAIKNLLMEMKLAHKKCSHLIPLVDDSKKTDSIKLALYSFWNRKKVEQALLELKDHVDRCSHHFHLLSGLRTEAHILEIHDRIVQPTAPGLVGIYRQSNLGNMNILHSGVGIVTNSQLVSFTQSNPMPMTWIADIIPAHDFSKVYLHREVGLIAHSFQLVLARWSQNPPTNMEISPVTVSWKLGRLPVAGTLLHQDSFILVFRIQSLLHDSQSNLWVEDAYLKATDLAINLQNLDMHDDAIAIWALLVDLRRAIAKVYPSPTSSRRLSVALVNLSAGFFNKGDQKLAQSNSDEAIEILRSLIAHEPIDRLKKQDMVHLALNLTVRLTYKPYSMKSHQLAVDAGRMFEDALGISDQRLRSAIVDVSSSPTISSSNLAVILKNQEISDDDWYAYGCSLLRIAKALDQPLESHKLTKLAVVVLNHLLAKYPHSDRVQCELSGALTLLSITMMQTGGDFQADTENLEYIKQNITILRQQVLIHPQHYVLRLADALWAQRQVLLTLGRLVEADCTYQNLIGLHDFAAAPPHLHLHIPSETEAKYYTRLAQYHYASNRFTDAIYATQKAISQYSALEFMDPVRSFGDHIRALALLCKSLNGVHHYDAVLSEGLKAIKMIDNSNIHHNDSDIDGAESYADVLIEMMQALEASSHPGALVQAAEINARIRTLARSGKVKHKFKLASALVEYAALLCKHWTVEHAIETFQDIYDDWEILYGGLEDPTKVALEFTDCVRSLQHLLERQGQVEKALSYNKAARAFIKNLADSASNELTSCQLNILNRDHIFLLCRAGHYPEALKLSQLMIWNIRKDSQMVANTAEAFYCLALTQLRNYRPNDAIATAIEALSHCQTKLPKGDPENITMRVLSYHCLIVLTDSLHDNGRVDEALNRLDQAEMVALQLNSVASMEELEATGEDSHEYLLFRRSMLLFAKEDYSESARLIKKVEAIRKEKSKQDKTALRRYAITLSYSHVLYCALGSHEEGFSAAFKLEKLKENVRVTSPAVASLIDVELDYMSKRGAWKFVQSAGEKLMCTH